jgi:monoamine oxidase
MGNAVIIIGAGAAGLMAARTLAKAGTKVTVLEARDRIGGRIHTLSDPSFVAKTELGAEFIHGDLPVTLNLLAQAGIASQSITLKMWRYRDGKFKKEEEQAEGWDEVMKKLGELQEDIPIAEFMKQYFGDEKYAEVTRSVLQFVAGYDSADPAKASAFALRNEWQHEEDGAQHRIADGYGTVINFLAGECKMYGGAIELNTIVSDIYWQVGKVSVTTDNGSEYQANKIIIALPLGVLQVMEDKPGAIHFHPPVPGYVKALGQIGFGAIIKILLQFDAPFWEDERYGNVEGNAFLFTEEKIPTWWTQGPGNPLLTGWLGGGTAQELKDKTDDEILQIGMQSLAHVFKRDADLLKTKLLAWRVVNWTTEPFTRGSYAYDMVGSDKARSLLIEPVENTLFFAGEYLYSGPAMGTVEAALDSGLKAAERCQER